VYWAHSRSHSHCIANLLQNVGQNNVELWSLESGGGWIHPVHIHMIDGFCVAIRETDGVLKPCAPELFNVPKDVIHIG
jgi:spore coat protein A, manganese oxidase